MQHLQPAVVNRKGPVLLRDSAQPHTEQSTLHKLNDLGYEVLPHPPYSPDLSPTHYHFFKHLDNFLQGKCFHNQQEAEIAFQEFVECPRHGFLCNRNKHSFLIGKSVLIVMAPILMTKDVLKLSYNGLEFTVQNHNYFCTNLIIMSLTNMCEVLTVNKALG